MKNSKKGISLIVLVITIIVIIILAAAIVMSLSNNNVLTNSRRAVNESDFSEVEGAWNIALQAVMVKQLDSVVISGEITASGFTGAGYAGDVDTGTTPLDTITDRTETAIEAITTTSLGLPAKFTNIAIADNRVVAIVKSAQLMIKEELLYDSTEGADNTAYESTSAAYELRILDSNFTGNILDSANATLSGDVHSLLTGSKAWQNGGSGLVAGGATTWPATYIAVPAKAALTDTTT